MNIKLDSNEYEVVENYKEALKLEDLIECYTDYFYEYDYIVGDWSYGKLRLKGFCNRINKMCNKINDYKFKDEYLKNLCNYECPYFIIKKINTVE